MLIRHLMESSTKEAMWAIGNNVVHGTRPYMNRIKNGTFDNASIVWVNIEDVFNHTESGFTLDVNDPAGGKNAIGDRITKAKAQFDSGFMNPSELSYSKPHKSIVFDDGRHRMVAAYQRGEHYAPAIVPNGEVENVKRFVRTIHSPESFDEMKRILTKESELHESVQTSGIFYHGTNRKFDSFDVFSKSENRATNVTGVYLTPSIVEAGEYGERVLKVEVHPANPFKGQGFNTVNDKMVAKLRELLLLHTTYRDRWLDTAILPTVVENGNLNSLWDVSGDIKREALIAGGYDSYIDGRHVVILNPTQTPINIIREL